MSTPEAFVDGDSPEADWASPPQASRKRPRACRRCHQRKVRCDGALPACANCSKHGIECKRAARPPTPAQDRYAPMLNQFEGLANTRVTEAKRWRPNDCHLSRADTANLGALDTYPIFKRAFKSLKTIFEKELRRSLAPLLLHENQALRHCSRI